MKYTGSKNNIAKYILPIMLKDRNGKNWVEPFVGGANMIDKVDGYRFGYDNNEYLICLLNHVKNGGFIEKREISKNIDFKELSIIYCDPPYELKNKRYKEHFDSDEFWKWCREKSNEGHTVFISEYNAPNDFECIWEKEISKTNPKQKVNKTEKLFKYNNLL